MQHSIITDNAELKQFCESLAAAEIIAFDTEFVSEDSYRSQLCLVQVAAGDRLRAIDALAVDMAPFWETLVAGDHQTIVHAGREELVFCLDAVGKAPRRLFDVQIAAGLAGREYPAGYGNLVRGLLKVHAEKGETRTDWRRRPLSDRQIGYALEDVRHLMPMRDRLQARLEQLGRLPWLDVEMEAWQAGVLRSRQNDRWRRVSGSSGLDRRSMAIVRDIWRWRAAEAERRDCPPRRLLRDDLIVELAKRRSDDPKRIRAVRGMDRGELRRALDKMAGCVRRALDLPDDELPEQIRQDSNRQLTMIGQFLSAALTSICREAKVAPALVGTPSDVRDLVAYRLEDRPERTTSPPALACGWRAELVGKTLDDLLAGRVAIRITDPASQRPLSFERD